jgi:hypothetical protein
MSYEGLLEIEYHKRNFGVSDLDYLKPTSWSIVCAIFWVDPNES